LSPAIAMGHPSFWRDIRPAFAAVGGTRHVDLASQRGRCPGLCALAIASTYAERAARDHPDIRRSRTRHLGVIGVLLGRGDQRGPLEWDVERGPA
jgi:hypothetical protein